MWLESLFDWIKFHVLFAIAAPAHAKEKARCIALALYVLCKYWSIGTLALGNFIRAHRCNVLQIEPRHTSHISALSLFSSSLWCPTSLSLSLIHI